MNEDFNILVVEDSPTQALQLQMILEEQGYGVATAGNGIEGLDLFRQDFFPIVITDWIMPEMDGHEFCQAVRSRNFDDYIYIFILTTKDSTNDIISGLEAGADDYLIKPVDPAELVARLETAKRIISLEQSLKQRNKEILLLSNTDPLTQTYNRRYLNDHLPSTLKHACRYDHPLSVIICDLDHFKNINDIFGHQAGDSVLQTVAEILKDSIRDGSDWVSRYGGEEFVLVLPETDLEGARKVAERLRRKIFCMEILSETGLIKISASFGIASIDGSQVDRAVNSDTLIKSADACLYRAKEEGRNRSIGVLL